MPDTSDADLSTPSRPLVAAADCSPLLTDAMLVDEDASNLFISLSSWDCPMPIDPPPNESEVPRGKHSINGIKADRAATNVVTSRARGGNLPQSRGPPPSDSSLYLLNLPDPAPPLLVCMHFCNSINTVSEV